MKLPSGGSALIDIAKLRDYCLNPNHPRGRHKARVFRAALGITALEAGELVDALATAARHGDAVIGASDTFGVRYIIDFGLKREGRSALVRSCWIILKGESRARFVTCYVLQVQT